MTGLLLSGCQTAAVDEVTPTPAESMTPVPSVEPEVTSLTFTDSMGRITEFDQIPETVISLSPTLTEIVYALDMGSKLIGRTDWCDYPDQVFEVPSVGNMDIPNFEVIVSLNPDVVAVSLITNEETVKKLEEAGIKCVVIDEETTFEGAYGNITLMGTLLGADDKAASIVSDMKQKVADITAKLTGVTPKTVYYIMGYGEYGDFTAGAGTFISELIKMAGGINVADDTTDWSYSVEKLVSHDPDVLICSLWAPASGLKTTAGYMDLSAVKKNAVYTIDDNLIQRIGPRITDGLYAVAKALHPTLF
ncbi:MAG: ABC transporter substrate-binding protein [Clostridia bacterium]|nr:ABC transporter substrate-binding protein [Clostridia bacterium]